MRYTNIHDSSAMRLYGLQRYQLVAIFLHNLLARHGEVPKLDLPPDGRKHKQASGILRSEVKYFLSLYPDARQWGEVGWDMFLHMNPAEPPERLRKYVDKLITRASINAPVQRATK